ncbi:hypothetical protein PSCICN_48060 [Pseudomonas cichorii]|nr:hypothetical protein PSCICN_48060 [Pseudomonas cichorii]
MLWQLVNDIDTGQIGRQGFALATVFSRLGGFGRFFVSVLGNRFSLAFCLVEECQLGRVCIGTLFGLAIEQTGKVEGKEFDINATVTIGPGAGISGSVGYGATNGSTNWVGQQTSITGKDKVDIRTENHTQLDGALIASIAAISSWILERWASAILRGKTRSMVIT